MKNNCLCIIINWNASQDTLNTIDSLKIQSYIFFDIVVVDNHSTDNSLKHLHEYSNNFQHKNIKLFTIFSSKNLGFAGGVNLVLKNFTKYKYYWLLNNDAVPKTDCLENLLTTLVGKKYSFCSSVIINYYDRQKLESFGLGRHIPYTGKSFLYGKNHSISCIKSTPSVDSSFYYLSGASLLVDNHIINEIGLMNEDYFMYAEEKDWQFRAKKKGLKIGISPNSLVYHKKSSSFKNNRHMYYYYLTRSNIIFENIFFGLIAKFTSTFIISISTIFKPISLKCKIYTFKGIFDAYKFLN